MRRVRERTDASSDDARTIQEMRTIERGDGLVEGSCFRGILSDLLWSSSAAPLSADYDD